MTGFDVLVVDDLAHDIRVRDILDHTNVFGPTVAGAPCVWHRDRLCTPREWRNTTITLVACAEGPARERAALFVVQFPDVAARRLWAYALCSPNTRAGELLWLLRLRAQPSNPRDVDLAQEHGGELAATVPNLGAGPSACPLADMYIGKIKGKKIMWIP